MLATDAINVLRQRMPVHPGTLSLHSSAKPGLVIVDEINGFAKVGAGPLAPATQNDQVDRMVAETDRLARLFDAQKWPILVFLDTHIPGKPEPPYPPHCEAGSGQEELVDDLKWLENGTTVTQIRKDCINGFIGSIAPDGDNKLIGWINNHKLSDLIVVGICTDICVMDFVLTLLSARNHGMVPPLRDIHVYEPGCATYDLPLTTARAGGLPDSAAHPQGEAHHMGLYFMASRGANLIDRIDISADPSKL